MERKESNLPGGPRPMITKIGLAGRGLTIAHSCRVDLWSCPKSGHLTSSFLSVGNLRSRNSLIFHKYPNNAPFLRGAEDSYFDIAKCNHSPLYGVLPKVFHGRCLVQCQKRVQNVRRHFKVSITRSIKPSVSQRGVYSVRWCCVVDTKHGDVF